MNLLLLSNSTLPSQDYLSWPKQYIIDFTQQQSLQTVFIPFAGVTIEHDSYTAKVQKALPWLRIEGIHRATNILESLEQAELVIVGGGNTFMLYKLLHEEGLMLPLRERVQQGLPFIGWSAGSNLACPGLYTTNDMPIAEPPSFAGLNVIPFQINPHFTDAVLPNHGGETRSQRIAEYLEAQPSKTVVGLVEGALIIVKDGKYYLKGSEGNKIFRSGVASQMLPMGDITNILTNS